MIDFVLYLSTAQDQLGYVILDGHGTARGDFVGGPALPDGVYRVQDGSLIPVELSPPKIGNFPSTQNGVHAAPQR
jgi:hypothetical protein